MNFTKSEFWLLSSLFYILICKLRANNYGVIPCYSLDEASYRNLEEQDILKILQEKMLSPEEFQALVEQVKPLL